MPLVDKIKSYISDSSESSAHKQLLKQFMVKNGEDNMNVDFINSKLSSMKNVVSAAKGITPLVVEYKILISILEKLLLE